MSSLLPVNVKVIVCEYGASYRAYSDCLSLNAHFFDDFSEQLVYCAMRTSRAIVHYIVCENWSFLVDDVLRFLYIFDIHGLCLFQIVELLELLYNFIRCVDVSTLSSVEAYRAGSVYCKSHVVYHLTEVQLDAHHALYL